MTVHHIVPPYLLDHLERTVDDPNLRARYRQSLERDAVLRTRPAATPRGEAAPGTSDQGATPAPGPQRTVHDAERETTLPGRLVRSEGDPGVADLAVNESYEGLGATWALFQEVFGRDSVDGAGLPLVSTVHYGRGYANAFWDGAQMVFGDGDGVIFRSFTSSLDITGHEISHGVVQFTAGLAYRGQSGALNESLADVFGSLVKQRQLGQTSAKADWIIGAGIFTPDVAGVGLRSLARPGTAYDDPRLGKDPQPAHMSGYVETEDDNGGVHLNSGIPNHAFYLVATTLGGAAYDLPGRIWYQALTSGTLPTTSTFTQFADATIAAAKALAGDESAEVGAVQAAWRQVGVLGQHEGPADEEESNLMRAAQTTLDHHTPPPPPDGDDAPEEGDAADRSTD
ncbi:thermolysin metallopeptidase-like protein [Kribbella amoyensis]|uniref:Neutral metalloproteinase n=1 Tax=Kribbella amoyensis TaxID=996641 RepID=A0A561BNJ5_9ACTN|nr:M4 family metallopeptidase [Kribbella amoyensis]TWD80448.1 thermolysin metallopeptidase-like protein [Kribbella amoyensis]